MTTDKDSVNVATLPGDECARLLATQEVGRLGFINDGRPEILPVNFAFDGGAIVFATASGGKLWGVTRSPVVFEVDGLDPASRSGWSVVVHGLAQEITSADAPSVLERLEAIALSPWVGQRPHLVRIPAADITGRRVGPVRPDRDA